MYACLHALVVRHLTGGLEVVAIAPTCSACVRHLTGGLEDGQALDGSHRHVRHLTGGLEVKLD